MRSLKILGVLLCTLLAINVRVAWATSASVGPADCDAVTFNYTQFPLTTVNVTEIVRIDGVEVVNQVTPITKPAGWGAAPYPHLVPINPGPGTHSVVAITRFPDHTGTVRTARATFTINCEACVRGTPNPAGAHASGDAFGVYVNVLDAVKLPKRPFVSSFVSGVGTSNQDDVLLTATLPNLLNLGVLNVASTATVTESPAEAKDLGVAEVADINLLKGMIKAKVVRASAQAIARGDSSAYSSAGSTFENLVINGKQYNNVAPNTRIKLPVVPGVTGVGSYVVLHERLGKSSAPAAGVLAGGTYSADLEVNMIHVVVKGLVNQTKPLEITVAHAEAHADFPQTKACPGDNNGNTVSGHAFTASLNLAPTPDFDTSVVVNGVAIEPTGGTAYIEAASVNLPGPNNVDSVDAAGAQSYSTGTVTPDSATSSSYANVADVNLFGVIKATVVKTQSNSAANVDGGTSDANGTELLGLTINGTPYGGNAPPNTVINLPGLGFVVFNEQIPDAESTGHTGLTVRAIRVVVTKLGLEVIVAESHSDAFINNLD